SSSMHIAATNGHTEIVRMLLGDSRTSVNDTDRDGLTALQCAVDQWHLQCVEILLQHNADVNRAYPDGSTPLHRAAGSGRPELVSLLL
ncbi:ankyrin, partial [Cylindrobasidium torrendii FP15055 ss-10]